MTNRETENPEETNLAERFAEIAKEFEGSTFVNSANPQLTHIEALLRTPIMQEIVEMGLLALPLVYEKLKSNIYYYLFFKAILEDKEIEVPVDLSDFDTKDESKLSHLEPYRKAYLEWWKENRERVLAERKTT